MSSVASEGRTVLFVSHNLGAVRSLCTSAVLLQDGQVAARGAVGAVVSEYLQSLEGLAQLDLATRKDRRGGSRQRLLSVCADSPGIGLESVLVTGAPARIRFSMDRLAHATSCAFTIYNERGLGVAHFSSAASGPGDSVIRDAGPVVVWETEELPLLPGRYRLNAALFSGGDLEDHVEGALYFTVESGPIRGRAIPPAMSRFGSVCFPHRWTTGTLTTVETADAHTR
jgi:lipopolysaccharide transport system ATP-binding protein